MALARAYAEQGRLDKAVDRAARAVQLDPRSAEARALLASCYLGSGSIDRAIEEYRQARVLEPGDVETRYVLVHLFVLLKRRPEAIRELEAIRAIRPLRRESQERLAGLFLEEGQYGAAAAEYERILSADSSSSRTWEALGLARELGGEREGAARAYRRAAELNADNLSLRKHLIGMYISLDSLSAANMIAREVLERDSVDRSTRMQRGLILYDLDSLEQAAGEFSACLTDSETGSNARFYLARVLFDREMFADAQVHIDTLLAAAPRFGNGWVYRGFLLLRRDRQREAMEAFREAIRWGIRENIYYLMAMGQAEAGNHAGAAGSYRRALLRSPWDTRLLYGLGVASEKTGDVRGAVTALKRLLRARPRDASALNYLGYLYADRGIHLQEAVLLIGRALEIEPENGYFIDSLGWAYFRLGRIEEARQELERASALAADAVIFDHLGDVYRRLGRNEKAREAWGRSLELDPQNDQVRAKLQPPD
jgi:tetratricopeptide (TPR) repeat protein